MVDLLHIKVTTRNTNIFITQQMTKQVSNGIILYDIIICEQNSA